MSAETPTTSHTPNPLRDDHFPQVLLPWSLVFFTVKDASEVYSSAPPKDVGLAVGFGALWGMGSVAFGVGVDAVGAALGFSLILVRFQPRTPESRAHDTEFEGRSFYGESDHPSKATHIWFQLPTSLPWSNLPPSTPSSLQRG